MTVKELIIQLETLSPNKEVKISETLCDSDSLHPIGFYDSGFICQTDEVTILVGK